MGEFVRIVWSSLLLLLLLPAVSSSLFVSSSTSAFNLTWSKTLFCFLFHVIENTFSFCSFLFYRDRGHSLLPCVLFFIEDNGRARESVCVYVCVCMCARRFFSLFSENSVIPSLLLHEQNEIRSPLKGFKFPLVNIPCRYSRVVRVLLSIYPCDSAPFLCLRSFNFTCFLFPALLCSHPSSVRWRFVGFYSSVYIAR